MSAWPPVPVPLAPTSCSFESPYFIGVVKDGEYNPAARSGGRAGGGVRGEGDWEWGSSSNLHYNLQNDGALRRQCWEHKLIHGNLCNQTHDRVCGPTEEESQGPPHTNLASFGCVLFLPVSMPQRGCADRETRHPLLLKSLTEAGWFHLGLFLFGIY